MKPSRSKPAPSTTRGKSGRSPVRPKEDAAERRRRAQLADPHTSSPESEKAQDDNKPPTP